MKVQAERRVMVGFTGGMRSSVLSTLLQEQGYTVIPVYFDFSECRDPLWHSVDPALGSVTALQDAQLRAKFLGLELRVVAASGLFEQKVADPSVHSAILKLEEEPAILLHSRLIIPLLDQLAREQGCHTWATGHRVSQRDTSLFLEFDPDSGPASDQDSVFNENDQIPLVAFAGMQVLSRGMFPLGAFQQEHLQKLAQILELPPISSVKDLLPAQKQAHPATRDPKKWFEWISSRVPPDFFQRGWVKHPRLSFALADHGGYFQFPVGVQVRDFEITNLDESVLFQKGSPSEKDRTLWVVSHDAVDHTAWVYTRPEFMRSTVLLNELDWWEPQVLPQGEPVKAVAFQGGSTRPLDVGTVQFHLNATGSLELRRACSLLFHGTRIVFLKNQQGESRVVGTARVSSPVPISTRKNEPGAQA
jgi:tRNA U34 2-thiouridine synthase MnmA/TrmU